MRNSSGSQVRRFAESLNELIDQATFVAVEVNDGRHQVQMSLTADGLSVTDVATLEALGWSDFGD